MMLGRLELDAHLPQWLRLPETPAGDRAGRVQKNATKPMDDPSDQSLVLRTRRGQVEAYGDLVRRYQVSVYNVCYRILGERREAEDLAQDAFIRAYRRLETFDPERPFGPWIRRVATNLCYNHLQRSRIDSIELDEERDAAPDAARYRPEQSQDQRETAENVRTAILSLPPIYRSVIELRHYQEMSYTQIAATLDISMSQVKSHLFRARKALAGKLTGTGSLRVEQAERGESPDAD